MAKGGKAKRTRRPPASTSTAELDATVRRLTAPTPSDRRWVPNDEDEAPPVTEARPRRIWRSRTAPNHAGRVVPLHSYDPHAWQIACRCGWRSRAYRSPPSAFIDGPRNYQLNDPAAEEAARLLWREHAGASDTEIALGLEPHDDKLPIAGVGDRYSDDADRPYEDEGEDD